VNWLITVAGGIRAAITPAWINDVNVLSDLFRNSDDVLYSSLHLTEVRGNGKCRTRL
jgi:hypothetical protein